MDALLFALVLEVALLQLKIQEGSTKLRSGFSKSKTKRETTQNHKLVTDRAMVRDVVCQTLVELAEQGQWTALRRATTALEQRARAAAALRRAHDSLLQSREATTKEFQREHEEWDLELRNADHKIANLRDQLKDDLLNASARLRYAERWLRARVDAVELRGQWRALRGPPAPRLNHEERVHAELRRAFELQITEHERSLEYWRVRYSDDTANINERLASVRDLYMETIRRRENLESVHRQNFLLLRHKITLAQSILLPLLDYGDIAYLDATEELLDKYYKLHDGEMQGWLRFKRERAARLERERRMRLAATRVQAWWRGVMVRHALGAFRHLRGSAKPPAKGKKK